MAKEYNWIGFEIILTSIINDIKRSLGNPDLEDGFISVKDIKQWLSQQG